MTKPAKVEVVPCSFNDSPSGTAIVVFFPGCNLRCPYCYNKSVVLGRMDSGAVGLDDVSRMIDDNVYTGPGGKRILQKEWITFSGGECTYYADSIIPLAKQARSIGMKVCCYTNGTNGGGIERLLPYADFFHVDFKQSYGLPYACTDIPRIMSEENCLAHKYSLNMIAESGVPFALKTTVTRLFTPRSELLAMAKDIYCMFLGRDKPVWHWGSFQESENMIQPLHRSSMFISYDEAKDIADEIQDMRCPDGTSSDIRISMDSYER